MYDKLPVADRSNFFDSLGSAICRSCNTHVEVQQHFSNARNLHVRNTDYSAGLRRHAPYSGRVILRASSWMHIIMDAIESNMRNFLKLPDRPSKWQVHQGTRSVFAAVQQAIISDGISFYRVLSPRVAKQRLYQKITGDHPSRQRCSWMEGLLTSLWDFSFNH